MEGKCRVFFIHFFLCRKMLNVYIRKNWIKIIRVCLAQFQKFASETVPTYVYENLRDFRMGFVNLITNIFSNVMCSTNTTERINLPSKSNE